MMRSLLEKLSHSVQRGLLGGASLLVARHRRSDWCKEWRGELWHVRRETAGAPNSLLHAETVRVRFCLGAFADAWCLHGRFSLRPRLARLPALDCILWLACALCVCAVVMGSLPGVRAELEAMHYRVRTGVVLIQDADSSSFPIAAVTPREFRDWQATKQRFFDAISYYRSAREPVAVNGGHALSIPVARVSSNFFAVLGIPLLLRASQLTGPGATPEAVLSRRIWVTNFDASPSVVGRELRINGQRLRIAGVAPASSLPLPDSPAVWVVGSAGNRNDSDSERGFVIAHLSKRGQAAFVAHGNQIPIAVAGEDPDEASLLGVTLRGQSEGPEALAGFALFLAFLALPAVVSVSLGESSYSAYRPSVKRRCMRWLFLAAKMALVITIAFCASMAVAYGFTYTFSPTAELAQCAAGFVFSLLGLRWSLFDQRHRCPVCLRPVTNPTRVGLASHTFLGWNGTEMFCTGGHTLLHVPALPTSWFQAPRWVYLDPSWGFLFTP